MHSCHVSNDDDSRLLFIAPEEAYSLPAHRPPEVQLAACNGTRINSFCAQS